ncbi:MAG: hypothetical protein JJE51_06580 [Thermoanaerobaculia bacterium]|nr:hypothetical protein [Thermoanaerobaculia bacterium]
MRALIGIVATMAILIGASMLATETLGDRELFTSPPDVVSEGFIREVVTKRYSRARMSFSNPDAVSDGDMRRLAGAIEDRVGIPSRFEAETIARDDRHARTKVRLESAKGSFELELSLDWSKGVWKVYGVRS